MRRYPLSPTQDNIFHFISQEEGTIVFDSGWRKLDKNNKPIETIYASSVRAVCRTGLLRTRNRRTDGKLELILDVR